MDPEEIKKSFDKIRCRFDEGKEEFDRINKRLDNICDDQLMELKNGSIRRLKVKEAVSDLHSDMKEVKTLLEPLLDFAKVHQIIKKYKLYRIIIPAGGLSYLIILIKSFIN